MGKEAGLVMQFIYKGARFRQSGTTMQKVKPLHEMARRASVHSVCKGFPTAPFETEEDVAAYTSGDTICCLLCGRHMKALGSHLAMVHDTNTKDYRARFNIPWRYSLVCSDLRERRRQIGLRPQNRERIRSVGKTMKTTGYRPRCRMGQDAITAARKGTYGGYVYDNFEWHLEQVRTVYGRPRPPEGLPSWNTFKKRRASDPALQAEYLKAKSERQVHPRTARRRKERKGVDTGTKID